MSEIDSSNPFEYLDSDHLNTLDEFDKTQSYFYDWLAEKAVNPAGITTDNIELREYIDDLSTAFVELAISCRAEANDLDTAKADIAELWKQDDSDRVELFTGLIGENYFSPLRKEDVEQTVNSIFAESDNDQELAQNIREMYGGYVAGDVFNFVGCLNGLEDTSEGEDEERILLDIDLKEVALRARSVASFALAVGLGVVIGKKFLR